MEKKLLTEHYTEMMFEGTSGRILDSFIAPFRDFWPALKGRLMVLMRNVIDWGRVVFGGFRTSKEWQTFFKENDTAVAKIKLHYKKYEDKWKETTKRGASSSEAFFMYNPQAAIAQSIAQGAVNIYNDKDVWQLANKEHLGLTLLPGVGGFFEEPHNRKVIRRTVLDDGSYSYEEEYEERKDYDPIVTRAFKTIDKIFYGDSEPDPIKEGAETDPSTKPMSQEEVTKKIIQMLEMSGVFEDFNKSGKSVINQKQVMFERMLTEAEIHLKMGSDIVSAENYDIFTNAVKLGQSKSKILQSIDLSGITSEIQKGVDKIKTDPKMLEQILEKKEAATMNDEELFDIVFQSAKGRIALVLLKDMEAYYEEVRSKIFSDVAPEDLDILKGSENGDLYRDLVLKSIKRLNTSLTSLKKIGQSNKIT